MPIPHFTLQQTLKLDAAVSGAMAALLIAGATPLGALTALDPPILRGVGIVLLPFVAFVLWAAHVASEALWPARLVVWANGGWVMTSLCAVPLGLLSPNGLGLAFVLLQAFAVALFAVLQARALRQHPAFPG